MNQISHQHMRSSSTTNAFWSTSVLRNRARLTSRSPEYWVHHMGREKALAAALQLQHDAGLILSNVQVLQQLVTALSRAAGCTWSAAISGQCNSTGDAILQSTPCGTLHDGDGSVAPTPAVCRVAMRASPARIAFRRCLCEPGGEIELSDSD